MIMTQDDDNIVKSVLGLYIKVKTESGKERYIGYTDLENESVTVSVTQDRCFPELRKTEIKIVVECDSFSMVVN